MKKICLGKITAPHGVKGLVKILPYGDDVSLMNGETFLADGRALHVTLKNKSGKYILAEIEGVQDRDGSEALQGEELYVPRDRLPPVEEGQHYIEDLKGLDVVEDGVVIGTVLAVDNFGAGDLLDIRLQNGESFYLPFLPTYVLEVGTVVLVQNHKDMIL